MCSRDLATSQAKMYVMEHSICATIIHLVFYDSELEGTFWDKAPWLIFNAADNAFDFHVPNIVHFPIYSIPLKVFFTTTPAGSTTFLSTLISTLYCEQSLSMLDTHILLVYASLSDDVIDEL